MFQQLDGIPVKPFDDFNDSYIKSNDKAGDVVGLPKQPSSVPASAAATTRVAAGHKPCCPLHI
jgi:hypothetical protein